MQQRCVILSSSTPCILFPCLLLKPHRRRGHKVPPLRPPMGSEKDANREEVRRWAELGQSSCHCLRWNLMLNDTFILFWHISLFYLCSFHRCLWLAGNMWSDETPYVIWLLWVADYMWSDETPYGIWLILKSDNEWSVETTDVVWLLWLANNMWSDETPYGIWLLYYWLYSIKLPMTNWNNLTL